MYSFFLPVILLFILVIAWYHFCFTARTTSGEATIRLIELDVLLDYALGYEFAPFALWDMILTNRAPDFGHTQAP